MHVPDALKQRKSVRAFLNLPVARETIERILDAARYAPSGVNTQPWRIAVVMGDAKRALEQKLEAAFRRGVAQKMDYPYYPTQWPEPYRSRRTACGLQLYSALGIQKEETERRTEQWARNYRAFDAPVMLFFFMDAGLEIGSFLDYGMFLQSVMLAAVDAGLATCPQAALGEYPDIVRAELGYPPENLLVCGMAMGYEETDDAVNRYRTHREDVAEFTKFFGCA